MASTRRVAVVTGANKGIGFAVVRGLCKQLADVDVYLTARNDSLGQEAVKKLEAEGLKPKFHQLDLNDSGSIDKLKTFLQSSYGGLDILVNNAGMAFKNDATEPFPVQAEVTVKTNFWGTLNVCNSLFPLLRPHARVVNVSSRASCMSANKCSDALKQRFVDPDIDMANVKQLMTEFVCSAKDGSLSAAGWRESGYGCSKIGVTLMSFVQQKELDTDPREDIIVNACCPGYVDTDMTSHMTSHKVPKTIDEGADTLVYLGLLPPNTTSPRGQFVAERKIINWPSQS